MRFGRRSFGAGSGLSCAEDARGPQQLAKPSSRGSKPMPAMDVLHLTHSFPFRHILALWWEVGADPDEAGSEVAVDAVDVVVVHHGRGPHDPRIRLAGRRPYLVRIGASGRTRSSTSCRSLPLPGSRARPAPRQRCVVSSFPAPVDTGPSGPTTAWRSNEGTGFRFLARPGPTLRLSAISGPDEHTSRRSEAEPR